MVNQDILNYLKSGLESKMKLMDLKSNLISNGWDLKEIELAISELTKGSNINLSEEDISLPEMPERELDSSLAAEVNIQKENPPVENTKVEKALPVQKNISDVVVIQEDQGFLSRKNMIIIGASFFALVLILVLIFSFSGGDASSVPKNLGAIDIFNGTTIEFNRDQINFKIGEKVSLFKIVEVTEYIIKYEFGEFKGELFMKEDSLIDIDNDGISDVILRLEEVDGDVPNIYIKEL